MLLISCEDDGFVIKLNYLNSRGRYENVNIKKFESGEKLSDRIDITKTEYYKKSDKEQYDKATANVIIENDCFDSPYFGAGNGIKFIDWKTKPQGAEGAVDWSIDSPITEDIEVYAQYDFLEFVHLEVTSITGFDSEVGLEEFIKTITAEAEGESRNFTAIFTISIIGASLKKTLTIEEIREKVKFCSGIDPITYSLYLDPSDPSFVAEIVDCEAEAGESKITFKINFIGEDCPEEETSKSGKIVLELAETDLKADEDYYFSTIMLPSNVIARTNFIRLNITYEAKN